MATLGAKAANLARAARSGLPVLPGVVLTVAAAAAYADPSDPTNVQVRDEWTRATSALVTSSGVPLVVRSSSPGEDSATESRAGRYTSVVDVIGKEPVEEATRRVIASGEGTMAVLAQPLVDASVSGVLFGVDPVSGQKNRLLVAAVDGLPERLVSGESSASHYSLSRRGRVRSVEHPEDGVPVRLSSADLRGLARLARSVAALFGGPQDVEWAIDRDAKLWLLQSRPVTTHAEEPAGPVVFGAAGVDETFPDALSPLEADLWVSPMAQGIRTALGITRTSARRRIAESPVVTTVGGRVVADQVLIGNVPVKNHWFDPRPGYRRLSVAWRVGRLRGALVPLAAQALARTDRSLLSLPEAGRLEDEVLLGALDRVGESLAAAHGMEVLIGMLLPPSSDIAGPTGLSSAAGLLARVRFEDGAPLETSIGAAAPSDDELIKKHPVLLALLPPRIGLRAPLPSSARLDGAAPGGQSEPHGQRDALLAREALRLRVRWLQEAQAAMVAEIARRLHDDHVLADESLVRMLRLTELKNAMRTGVVAVDLAERSRQWYDQSAVLPERFLLSTTRSPIALRDHSDNRLGEDESGLLRGRGGGGGRGSGVVVHDAAQVASGAVLVVSTLDPRLAPRLAGLSGLVAETGSPLSHLAIVAREVGVPVVTAVRGARMKIPVGSRVIVDGATGVVQLLEQGDGAGEASESRSAESSTVETVSEEV